MRSGVEPGTYELKVKHLRALTWKPESAISGEPAEIMVAGENFPDGDSVTIKIYRQFQATDSDPIASLNASFRSGEAAAKWHHIQQTGEPPFGDFVAVATIRGKSIWSAAMKLQPHSVDSEKGLQQRLKHLKFYGGAIDGIIGPQSKAAIRKFQTTFPPLVVDGIAGPKTRAMLTKVTY
jgi:hypothetical protein